MTTLIAIEGVKVRQDDEGRYCLNDLHKAAMAAGKATAAQRPNQFLRTDTVQGFIDALETAQISAVSAVVTKEGRGGGSYAVELVAIRYAAWIDPAFEIQVYETFQALRRGEVELARGSADREKARLESRFLADAVKYSRTDEGKAVSHYHFSNEYDLINRVVLGCSSKQYRERHGLPKGAPIRDHLTPGEVATIAHLQAVDTGLIEAGLSFEQRKRRLSRIYIQRHATRLCSEVQRLEA